MKILVPIALSIALSLVATLIAVVTSRLHHPRGIPTAAA